MVDMILTVYLSDGEQALTEVPITPETTCRDVVEFCKEPGESGCHLAEVWHGNERAIPFDHMMYEHLQKWGPRKQEVKFYLRHEDSPTESSDQGSQQSQEQPSRREGSSSDMHNENGVGNPRVELTLSELQEMATRQQQQIEVQQQMLVAKEQRLRYLKQQERRQQQTVSETEKLQRLKERVESQEAKLKKIRAMRGQVDYSKVINGNLSAEIEHISGMFQDKQAELQAAVLRVDQLSQQLEDLRRGKLNGLQTLGGQVTGTAALELRKLYQELKPPGPWKVSDLDIIVDPIAPPPPEPRPGPGFVTVLIINVLVRGSVMSDLVLMLNFFPFSANDAGWPTLNKSNTSVKAPDWKESGTDTSIKTASPAGTPGDKDSSQMGSAPPLNKPQPPPYGAHTSNHPLSSANSGSTSSLDRRKDVPLRPVPSLPTNPPPQPAWPRVPPAPTGSSSQQIQQRISVPPSPTFQPSPPFFPPSERPDAPLAVAVRPFIPDKGSRPQSPRKGPATMNSSSIYHMYLQQAAPKNYPLNIKPAVKAVYGKPVLPPSSTPPSPLLFGGSGAFPALQGPGGDMLDVELDFDGQMMGVPEPPPPNVDHIPRPLSPTKLTPMVHSPMRYQSDAELEALRKKLANAPRPLKKRSSITEPEGPNGPNIQKLLYQRFNTLAGGMEGGMGDVSGGGGVTPFYQPSTTTGEMLFDADNGNQLSETPIVPSEGAVAEDVVPQGDANDNEPPEQVAETLTPPAPEPSEDNNNNPAETLAILPSPVAEASTPEEADTCPSSQPTGKRTNLKKPDSERTGHGLRVKFNPLALLLDATLEGEFDHVQRIIYEVDNPSTPNDEGITPLHNAVCAGHHHIVKFLLDFGVNVNAADSDGWTPLHCAASCNSVHLCKILVESGAAIFATTISDVETAADKCEEMEEGYIQCSQFLYGVQEKLGVMNKGVVYALWEYEAQSADELSFQEGDAITVLHRKDDTETEWWWSKLNDKEGYVPRNLLGLYRRIKPCQRSLA
uniref:SH3 domain-containing protein n=1 Tax=Sinocyclocheilus grahami TaxID=75366 RepID=A0A672PAD6_SINGR